jgi:hypothetical protein
MPETPMYRLFQLGDGYVMNDTKPSQPLGVFAIHIQIKV